jgi:hypothetical protein
MKNSRVMIFFDIKDITFILIATIFLRADKPCPLRVSSAKRNIMDCKTEIGQVGYFLPLDTIHF